MIVKRNYLIDIVRVLAIVGVIVVHTVNNIIRQVNFDILRLPILFSIERLFRYAVPLFFIVSGYTLTYRYGKRAFSKEFYYRRLIRIVIPYIIWSTLYTIMDGDFQITSVVDKDFIVKILTGSAAIHLYFIPAIVLLNVFYPFLLNLAKKITPVVAILFTVAEILLLSYDYYITPLPVGGPLRVALLNTFMFVVGILTCIHEKKVTLLVQKWFVSILAMLPMLYGLLIYQTLTLFLGSKRVDIINSQWQPLIFLITILLWLVLIAKPVVLSLGWKQVFEFLSRKSFFVYFIHVGIISIFWKIYGSRVFSSTEGDVVDTFWFAPISFIFVLFVSYLCAYLILRIPYGKTLLGDG